MPVSGRRDFRRRLRQVEELAAVLVTEDRQPFGLVLPVIVIVEARLARTHQSPPQRVADLQALEILLRFMNQIPETNRRLTRGRTRFLRRQQN